MRRIKLTVAYDGTDFCGFQVQPGLRTVEGVLYDALKTLTGEELDLIGASRTDSGVHSYGNTVVFDTESTIPPERFHKAVNTKLPDDVKAIASCEVAPDWHPRHTDCLKTYLYRADNAYVPDVINRRYAMHFPGRVDIGLMQEAAKYIEGEHDFTSFSNPQSQILKNGGSAVRTIDHINVAGESGGIITIEVCGNGFLYNMVRIIAGTLLDVGTGRFKPGDIVKMLEARDRTRAGFTAEAKGLFLKQIIYKN
ncbi:MAG: tRNA pseudouridine(38-40) synthase TruA [Eubacteriales bacterium]|nr:tRNA pseudouridine(38-40) synthase TruA [Eubacteriales bacterium]